MSCFQFQQSVTLHTDLGDVKIEVFCEEVPKASEVLIISELLSDI